MTVAYKQHSSVKVAVVTWTSAADGSFTADVELDGEILKVVTNPDGTVAPTDNYDITLVDEDGIDIAAGLLANRDTANSEEVYPYKELTLTGTATDRAIRPIVHSGKVTFTVANAGNAKSGVARIFYR